MRHVADGAKRGRSQRFNERETLDDLTSDSDAIVVETAGAEPGGRWSRGVPTSLEMPTR